MRCVPVCLYGCTPAAAQRVGDDGDVNPRLGPAHPEFVGHRRAFAIGQLAP